MCGIVGYIGTQSASDIIVDGLKRLEYRGYDSAGIAIAHDGLLDLRREVGKLRNLEAQVIAQPPQGSIGIGHTRWATHGRPTTFNAHPHTDTSGDLVVVHNGIIENYAALKSQLIGQGVKFASDTDTEVLAHLIASLYEGDLLAAVFEALKHVEGTYAIAVLHRKNQDLLVGARKGSPLIVGMGEGENYLASDIPAILNYTRQIVYLDEGQVAEVRRDGVKVYNEKREQVPFSIARIDWNLVAAEKAGFEHFMLKEIHEQPTSLSNAIAGRFDEREGQLFLDDIGLAPDLLAGFRRIAIVACGTAYYAGLVGKYLIEQLARIPTEVDLASEYRYRDPVIDAETLFIAVTQSGETADTLAAVREAKRQGATVLGLVNVIGSAIAREAHGNLYLHAGPEISVASTKAYTSMVAGFELLALHLGLARGTLALDQAKRLMSDLKRVPALVSRILENDRGIRELASRFTNHRDFLFLGRGLNYPTALEGALKLKEISYIHAEAYAAGELKHGPIALITHEMPVVAVATDGPTYDKVLSNIQEVKARDGVVIAVATEGNITIQEHVDYTLYVPPVDPLFAPLVNVIPLQLLSYHIARLRGLDVDQPRNLAKSVTVE
ncbi:MAG: glutamine--fructose-6-phosphate transaminase (isomerizing) [Candidatus Sericytochromatia bacterium]|nr:glutamine--fructose-6-phosphate transaminase (isomerizing) [Candidatus Sericytochromatia bacterium]